MAKNWERSERTRKSRIEQVKDFAESIGLPRDYINVWHNASISQRGQGWGAAVDPELARVACAQFDRVLNGKRPRFPRIDRELSAAI